MVKAQAQKIKSAIESTGLKIYSFNSDVTSNFYNDGKTAVAVVDLNMECIHAFKKNGFGGASTYFPNDKRVCYYFADFADVHEFRTAGTPEEIKNFVAALGLTLDDDQIKILEWMNATTSDLKPITGNYKFKYISDEEYGKLTPEEKAKYDEAKKQYELEKAGISGKASVSVTLG